MRTRAIPAAKPGTAADITYRQHAIIESVIADVIDGPFGSSTKPASSPAGTFTASPSPWVSVAKLDDVSGSLWPQPRVNPLTDPTSPRPAVLTPN